MGLPADKLKYLMYFDLYIPTVACQCSGGWVADGMGGGVEIRREQGEERLGMIIGRGVLYMIAGKALTYVYVHIWNV